MIVVRSTLFGKFGTGGQLAANNVAAMKKMAASNATGGAHSWRVLSDRSGQFDRVTLEVTFDSVADWEAARDAMFASPEFGESMRSSYDLVSGGEMEYLFIEGEGQA